MDQDGLGRRAFHNTSAGGNAAAESTPSRTTESAPIAGESGLAG